MKKFMVLCMKNLSIVSFIGGIICFMMTVWRPHLSSINEIADLFLVMGGMAGVFGGVVAILLVVIHDRIKDMPTVKINKYYHLAGMGIALSVISYAVMLSWS